MSLDKEAWAQERLPMYRAGVDAEEGPSRRLSLPVLDGGAPRGPSPRPVRDKREAPNTCCF